MFGKTTNVLLVAAVKKIERAILDAETLKSGQTLIECLGPNRRVEIDADLRTRAS